MTGTEFDYKTCAASCAHEYILPAVLNLVRARVSRGKILDFGCGNGFLANELGKLDFDVSGADVSVSGIEMARAAFPSVKFCVADLESDDLDLKFFPLETFDILVSTEVVEHVFKPRHFARNAFRLLRPGGSFIVTTPYHGYLKNLVLALSGQMDTHFTALWDGGHIKFWSRKTLTELLKEQGFQEVQFCGAGRFPYIWKSMILVARKPLV